MIGKRIRQALKANPQRVRTGTQESVPAPIGGWNARDSIASMERTDAILLDNWFPTPSDVMLRKGRDNHVTGISGQVESLMPYSTSGGTESLFGAAGTAFYDMTTAGAVGAAVQTGLTNARWQSINFATTAGSFLQCANGADSIRLWDGATWEAQTGISARAITGVTTSAIIHLSVHKNRVWMVQKDTLTAWYLPTDAIAGAANPLRLNGVAKKGGYLVAVDTWTIDGGDGVDDYWVAITSEGELIAYKGTDPSAASTFALHGVWVLGAPIGRRCFLKVGGELLVVTKAGVFPISRVLLSKVVDAKTAITDKITEAMKDAAVLYGDNFGWQLEYYPSGTMLLMNVPIATGSGQHQYVMNTITGAWCRFKDWEANCWAIHKREPYFGGNGVVSKVWSVFDDESANINGNAKTAFNYFRLKQQKKQWTMARPILASNGSPSILIGLNVDFDDNEPSAALTFSPSIYGVWDSSLWDVGIWGGGLSVLRSWQSVNGIGLCAATRLKTASQGIEVRWQSTDFIYKPASIGP